MTRSFFVSILCFFWCSANVWITALSAPPVIGFRRSSDLFEGDLYVDLMGREWGLKHQWSPNGVIRYRLSRAFTFIDRERIAAAMNELMRQTCVKFSPLSSDPLPDTDYLDIVKGTQCYAQLGHLRGRQELSLGQANCRRSKGKIMHLLMHSLGFIHEQSRTDRDAFVQVKWNRLETGADANFMKYSSVQDEHLNEPYDYQSIMHFEAFDFSRSKSKPAMIPTQPGIVFSDLGSGQRLGRLSETDVRKVNKLYCH